MPLQVLVYGCASARNKPTCDNRKLIKRESVEERILSRLRNKLMHLTLLAGFVAEYHREWNRLHCETTFYRSTAEAEPNVVSGQIDKIVETITAGRFHASMKAKKDVLEAHTQPCVVFHSALYL